MAYSWVCPFCDRFATITSENVTSTDSQFHNGNKFGPVLVSWVATTCPNPECKEPTISVTARPVIRQPSTAKLLWNGAALFDRRIRPEGAAKVLPAYLPAAIVEDYNEACLIRDLSPKASATLARRCLQGMIRNFWEVRPGRLVEEIAAIQDRVAKSTWDAIEGVRHIGNIGAHMEKDIDLIVEVEPEEAQMLIELIELLVNDWYVERHNRAERLAGIQRVAAEKKATQKGSVAPNPD